MIVPAASAARAVGPFRPHRRPGGLHVHFGAGKLGLGLVIPAISESDGDFVVVQRDTGPWRQLAESGRRVGLFINSERVLTLGTATRFGPGALGGILLTDAREHWLEASRRATSFSCSLGPSCADALLPVLSGLPRRPPDERPVLYACENSAESVRALEGGLSGRVAVTQCMVDRICYDKRVEPALGRIDVMAEEHPGSIVIYDPEEDPPMDGDMVTVTDDALVAEYMFSEKKCLVNGVHTALAFLTLLEHEAARGRREPCAGLPIDPRTCRDARLLSWCEASVDYLLHEHGAGLASRSHGAGAGEVRGILMGKATESLERFSSVSDTTSRVLSRGYTQAFEDRMLPVLNFAAGGGYIARPGVRDHLRGLETGCRSLCRRQRGGSC